MTAAIILNGAPFARTVTEDYVICADGGARLVPKEKINLIVGDMDSISDDYFSIDNIQVPAEKDFSDGELAINIAKSKGYTDISIYGADGGRPDHVLTNYMLLTYASRLGLNCTIKNDNCDVYYLDKKANFAVTPNVTISFLPFLCEEAVLSVNNVKYPLESLSLSSQNCSRGLSNITLSSTLNIEVEKGGVLFFYNR